MIDRLTHYDSTRTGKLAATYLGIIMAMTVIFSVVIFSIASQQVDRPLQPRDAQRDVAMHMETDDFRDIMAERAREAKMNLLLSLGVLNAGVLIFGAWFSTYLARRTMAPIEQAMEEQSRFVTDASHELRTPLTALQSMNEVALRRKKITDAEARTLAEQNMTEAAKLHALTTSLLGLVTAGREEVAVQPVDVQAAVSDAMATVVDAAQQKHITVEDAVPNIHVLAHRDKLTQVMRILLDNAVKYSDPKATVHVSAKEHGRILRLCVADTGIGIRKSDLPHVFSRFYRADTSRTKGARSGYGIGLAIAKSISDQMNWNISAESEVGKGSKFTIDLPIIRKK